MEGDDRTFGASLSSEGATMLRERVNEKLKEFMGDYTDDTLVEYVIVLLKNGRRKDEAESELNVFLGGDDSASFITWLWDHLGSNLSLYVQPREPHQSGNLKMTSATGEPGGRSESHQIAFKAEKGNAQRTPKKRQPREWKGLVKDGDANPLPQSSMADGSNGQDDSHRRVSRTKRPHSPRSTIQKKRRRPEKLQRRKREVSENALSAPRRLLQFALLGAVATSRPLNNLAEPSLKRLRSVVSTSTGDSFIEEQIHPVAVSHTAVAAAIKVVAEAAKGLRKVTPPHSVFDRLGQAIDVSDTINHQRDYRVVVGEEVDGCYSDGTEGIHFSYHQSNDISSLQDGNLSPIHDDTIVSSGLGHMRSGMSSVNRFDDSLLPSTEVDDIDGRVRRLRKGLNQPAASDKASSEYTSSVNTNIHKTLQHPNLRELTEMDEHKLVQDSDTVINKSKVVLVKENNNPTLAANGNEKTQTGSEHELQRTHILTGLHSTGAPTEDADFRTIFVSNVHFAATKNGLSKHFNKFGEVLKVIILTDAATGQPKGSAYVEFMRKEAAEHALSLDGTSFMSRIIKIVRKSSAHPEASSVITFPCIARAKFRRAPFRRGISSLYRPRIPIKPGTRSFQWKREAQPTATEALIQASKFITPPRTACSLTYVRTESKTV